MNTNFLACLNEILKWEGGNDDDLHDPGGRTSRGITQNEWNSYCKSCVLPASDVWTAPEIAITDIYKKSYWNPFCDGFPSGLDLIFFDMAVNQGPHEAALLLQRALCVKADGHIGVITQHEIQALTTAAAVCGVIHSVSNERVKFYKALKTFKYFGRGWMARVEDVEQQALAMAHPEAGAATA